MARILFLSTKERGHVHPLLGPAQWLRRLGHDVGWLCLPEAPGLISRSGIEPVSMALPPVPPGGALITSGPALAELVRDNDRLLPWIRALLIDAVPALVEPTREVFRAWRADLVVTDPMMYQGLIAAHLEGLPYACVSSSLNPITPPDLDVPHNRNMAALDRARKGLFRDYGMDMAFRVADALSPYVNIVFSTPYYAGPGLDIPPHTHLVGPSFPPDGRMEDVPFPWDELGGRPVVYLSFGSQISHQPEIFRKTCAVASELDVQVVLVAGELAHADFASQIPPNVVLTAFAPQLEVLKRATLTITHGGANTVMESLAAGVPLLISPVCNDQTIQAWFLERAGAGMSLDLLAAPIGEIHDALQSLLSPDHPARDRAQAIAADYAAHDGAREAARLCASLVEDA